MKKLCVIGDPIGHSLSPKIHAAFGEQTGIALEYTAEHVTPEHLEPFLKRFFAEGGSGLNVTVPHKESVWRWCQHLTARAEAAGAVNTLFYNDDVLTGDNTDGAGLVDDLLRQQVVLQDARVLLLGAGGAARGALGPLVDAGARVSIHNRTESRARQLIQDLGQGRLVNPDEGEFDVIISSSSAGLTQTQLTLPGHWVSNDTFAYDMIYSDQSTPFMQAAAEAGSAHQSDGLGMLLGQAARAFQRWTGVLPEIAPVMRILRK